MSTSQICTRQQTIDWRPLPELPATSPQRSRKFIRSLWRQISKQINTLLDLPPKQEPQLRPLRENSRLVRAVLLDTKQVFKKSLHAQADLLIAESYLSQTGFVFDEAGFLSYLQAVVPAKNLTIADIWALKPLLQIAVLKRLAENGTEETCEVRMACLRRLHDCEWKDIFEQSSAVEQLLRADPAGVYERMDFESRDIYRIEVEHLAKYSRASETEVVEAALDLARAAASQPDLSGRLRERAIHVGYYLVAEGRGRLERRIQYTPPFVSSVRRVLKKHPNIFYIGGIEVATFLIVCIVLGLLGHLTPIFGATFLMIVPATQAAVELMNSLTTFLIRAERLPKLDLSDGVPQSLSTLIAVPVLLLNEKQVRELVSDLGVRFLANQDPNIHFALLSDSPDSSEPFDEKDQLVDLARTLIRELNEKYAGHGQGGFFLLHRHRVYYESEQAWLGWERKRGKLLDLNKLLRNEYDSFPVKEGDTSVLPGIQYVICLDADTQLPRGTAQRLIGTLAHPLNRAIIDPAAHIVVQGYGILQPRVGISVQSASRSRLASIYSGQTGFDIYTRAVSDVYQDLYGEGIFTGKGIYEVDTLRAVLERRFPRSALLSHDLIEGAYARAGLVSDIEVIDDYPSHFTAYSKRKHRWLRGDWQIVTWLFERAPDESGHRVPNPISLISRWKILDNLRRSLVEPAEFALFLAGWFGLAGGPRFWTLVGVVLLLLPVYTQFLFSLIRLIASPSAPRLKDLVSQTATAHLNVLFALTFLAHQSLIDVDAILRANIRRLITRKKLLEWETAAEAESSGPKRTLVDTYLRLVPFAVLLIAILLYALHPASLPAASPLLLLWACSPLVSHWLNRALATGPAKLQRRDEELLIHTALLTWRYFREFSNADENWLVPDNVQETPARIAHRISPTNLGLLLNARLAACDLGFLSVPEFIEQTEATFNVMDELPKFAGHFYNWYATQTLVPLPPLFVSSVDSGNLAAALWTLKQGCLELAANPDTSAVLAKGLEHHRGLLAALPAGDPDVEWWTAEIESREKALSALGSIAADQLPARLQQLAFRAEAFVSNMDFGAVYDQRRKLLSIGFNVSQNRREASVYDLLASESRIGGFVAVAKGDIPQEAWFRLGRTQVLCYGEQLLLSWTGTMFEYLMPALWMRSYPGTLLQRSLSAAVRCQRAYAAKHGVPWGISESAYAYRDEAGNYQYQAFGLAALAMKESLSPALVVSPYSTLLALNVDPTAAIANLRRMLAMKWRGRYGFYEAADYTAATLAGRRGEHEVIRCWMAHHQGMSLLAICNLLCNSSTQRRFHQEPQVMATELILHEKAVPVQAVEGQREPELRQEALQPA